LSDIFLIQSEVASQIASALEVQLSPKETARITKIYTESLSAYDYYLKGREYYYRYRSQDNVEAISLFKKSLEIDPTFALASAGLADAFVQQTLRFGLDPFWLDSAVVRCENALALDQDLAEAYKALGLIYYTRSWFRKALSANKKALDLNPNYDPAIANLAWIYTNLGAYGKALPLFHKAVELNPTNPSITVGLGYVYLFLGDYDKSSQWLENTADLHPGHRPNPEIGLIMIDLLRGIPFKAVKRSEQILSKIRNDAALFIAAGDAAIVSGNSKLAGRYLEQAMSIEPAGWHPLTGVNCTTSMGFLFWKKEHKKEAEELFGHSLSIDQNTLKQGSEWWGVAYDFAAVNAIRGNKEEAYTWLEKAIDSGFRFYNWVQIDPLFENLREDSRFNTIIYRLKKKVEEIKTSIATS
jgi:tetratricopeptide (TPR) repeat protein